MIESQWRHKDRSGIRFPWRIHITASFNCYCDGDLEDDDDGVEINWGRAKAT